MGTFTFCNYWGKLFARLADGLAPHKRELRSVTTRAEVRETLKADSEIVALACRLAAHYAFAGTLVGFGVVEQDPALLPFRAYVDAMEVFIIAHEYAHCHVDERYEQFRGSQPDHVLLDLERACDLIASAVTQAYGARGDRWASYCNAGAVLIMGR